MGYDLSKKDLPEGEKVDLDRWERSYWARRFGVTDEELRQAIVAVGPLAEDVRKHLADKAT